MIRTDKGLTVVTENGGGSEWWRSVPVQIGLIIGFWQVGEVVVRLAHLPVPGAVVGFFLVLMLLARNPVMTDSLRRGANWFLAELLLFLLPTVAALLDHRELFGWLGLKIFAAILMGTLAVMLVTGLVVESYYRSMMAVQRVHYE